MGQARRRARQKGRQLRTAPRRDAVSDRARGAQQLSDGSVRQVLERIKLARDARDEAETELSVLVDEAVALGVGWPEIAAELGVSRQRLARATSADTAYGTVPEPAATTARNA